MKEAKPKLNKKGLPRKKTGPKGPTKPLSDSDFEKMRGMARIQCTQDEFCAIFDMSEQTLDARLKERGYQNFRDFYRKHSKEGHMSLRRVQWNTAQSGNVAMQIWLGKQILGQRDLRQVDNISSDGSMTPKNEMVVKLNPDASMEEIEAYFEEQPKIGG